MYNSVLCIIPLLISYYPGVVVGRWPLRVSSRSSCLQVLVEVTLCSSGGQHGQTVACVGDHGHLGVLNKHARVHCMCKPSHAQYSMCFLNETIVFILYRADYESI